MAVPTAPTATLIVTEALKIYGLSSPSASEITRATDYGLEYWTKWNLYQVCKKWRPLVKTYFHPVTEGLSVYANPTDFEEHLSLVWMEGDHSGVLQTADTLTLTLAADEDATADDVQGHIVAITSGTGIGQGIQIYSYSATTKIGNFSETPATTPVTSDGYRVINEETVLAQRPIDHRDSYPSFHSKGHPQEYSPLANDTYGKFELFPVPDCAGVVMQRYFANLMRIDLTATLYTSLLRRWQGVLTQGVLTWKLKESSNDKFQVEMQTFAQMINQLKATDGVDNQLTGLQIHVGDS